MNSLSLKYEILGNEPFLELKTNYLGQELEETIISTKVALTEF
jgi:hypothetical protein